MRRSTSSSSRGRRAASCRLPPASNPVPSRSSSGRGPRSGRRRSSRCSCFVPDSATRARHAGTTRALTHDLGAVTDVWARWDSVWFLRIAEHGYDAASGEAGVLPALPGARSACSAGCSAATTCSAGILVSLAAALGAFVLLTGSPRSGSARTARGVPCSTSRSSRWRSSSGRLHRVAVPPAHAGRIPARGAGALPGGRRRRRARAPDAADRHRAAAGARAARVARARAGRALAWLALAPLLFAAYPLLLWRAGRRPVGVRCARSSTGTGTSRPPARSAGSGTGCARDGPGSSSSRPARTRTSTGRRSQDADSDAGPPRSTSRRSRFLVLFVGLTVIAWRRFGAPYGLFAALSLALPLSTPSARWPLLSLPRFGLVVFPFFLALAWLGGRPRRAHGDRRRQRAPARDLGHAVGAVAVGGMRLTLVLAGLLLLLGGTACGERAEPTGSLVPGLPGHRSGSRRPSTVAKAVPQTHRPARRRPSAAPEGAWARAPDRDRERHAGRLPLVGSAAPIRI